MINFAIVNTYFMQPPLHQEEKTKNEKKNIRKSVE